MNDIGTRLSDRATATIIGVLFIVGTAAGVLSFAATGPVLGAPDYLAQIAAHRGQMVAGALLVLTMVFSLSLVPVVFYPVAKRYSRVLAMGYVVFRGALEAIASIAGVFAWLMLIALSEHPTAAAGRLADFLRLGGDVLSGQMVAVPFVIGALMFYYLLYSSRLVPRWLSIWGLVGAVLYLGAPLARMLGMPLDYLMGPLAIQEMVLAVWLIAKGFNASALAGASAAATDSKAVAA